MPYCLQYVNSFFAKNIRLGKSIPGRVFVCTYEPIGGDVENSRQDEELVIRHEARAALDPTNCVLFNDRALCLHFRREGCL